MSDALILPAEARERAGKGASRALRREGRIPAVVFGGKQEPTTIHVSERTLIVEIELGGEKMRTLPKDVATHPVTDRPTHVDFLRLAKGAKIDVNVPVTFINEDDSPGLKKGGVLNVVRQDLELVCEADKLPSEIVIDVTGKEVGDSIHISEVELPEGSESAITDRDFTIATLVAPSALKRAETEAEDADAAAEGEEGEGAEGESTESEEGEASSE
jgi:large subunit ribosomal protein L25